MNKHIFFLIPISILAIVGCQENNMTPEPTGTTGKDTSKVDSVKISILKPNPTKQPYILLEDDGFEAELIAQGIDTDNQINGKIAKEDVEKTESFGRPSVMQPNSDEAEYYRPMLKRYSEVMPLLKKQYKEKNGIELIVKKLSDISKFKKLKHFYIIFSNTPIDIVTPDFNTIS